MLIKARGESIHEDPGEREKPQPGEPGDEFGSELGSLAAVFGLVVPSRCALKTALNVFLGVLRWSVLLLLEPGNLGNINTRINTHSCIGESFGMSHVCLCYS